VDATHLSTAVGEIAGILRQLTDAGVKYKSYTEQYIDSLGIFGDAIVGIIGAIAAQERLRISERTKAGLARVRASGTRLGRPLGGRDINLARARKLQAEGLSITEIARRMKLSRSMVWARLKAAA
jgi:DNA invertase Pin-like site-specific DNA recombinase